jgi:hypothetical protein
MRFLFSGEDTERASYLANDTRYNANIAHRMLDELFYFVFM